MEPERLADVHRSMRRLNPTLLALLGGVVVLLLLVAYFATNRNSAQDKLTGNEATAQVSSAAPEKRCAGQATYDLIKRELFRRAAQLRGSDQATYDNLSNYAVIRMENPVMESENSTIGAVNCSGSLSLDLPPGVAVVGGRHTLTSDVDYTLQPAADGSGTVVLLRNADAIIAPLATLARVAQPQQPRAATVDTNTPAAEPAPPSTAPPAPPVTAQAAPPAVPASPPQRPTAARPSFDCARARTKGEVAVCANAGLAALDRNMAGQYRQAFAAASPDQRDLLRQTARRFYAYRDRCLNNACIGDAYVGRMREIRDIMEGHWRPRR